RQINMEGTTTQLLAIVANIRGAQDAVQFANITYLGFPFSISETFQRLNTNSTIQESWERVLQIQDLCSKHQKQLVIYISMGFGNPYGDPYDEMVIGHWIDKMEQAGIRIISLADTVGLATAAMVHRITQATVNAFPQLQIGVHLHSTAAGLGEKLDAALLAGCTRFDGAMKGIGGCPMANNDLVGNMDTESMIMHLGAKGYHLSIHQDLLSEAGSMASQIFQR
ncbi:MAG TPA: hypothetical protein VK907_04385, partial [Phnomibacter sp.]|nr:hypothetical protein [Phnomibacter sp.]